MGSFFVYCAIIPVQIKLAKVFYKMNSTWKPNPTINESNVYTLLHDYVYNPDRSPYYAEVINESRIVFTEAFNTILAAIIEVQFQYGQWTCQYTVYDDGEVIEHKSFTNLSLETIELINVIIGKLVIDQRTLYKEGERSIVINVDRLSKPAYVDVRVRREPIASFEISSLFNSNTADELVGNGSDSDREFVFKWKQQTAVNDHGNYLISNSRRAFLTADWFILDQINNSRYLPNEIQ